MDVKSKQVVKKIKQRWEKRHVLSNDTLFFLESTFSISEAFQLKDAMEQEDFPDRAIILEMILFPEQSMRLAVEPLLDSEGLKAEQVSGIVKYITNKSPRLTVGFPNEKAAITIKIPADQIELSISRLFLTHPVDPDICQMFEANYPTSTGLHCRVLLRCGNISFKKEKKQFLKRFILQAQKQYDGFNDLFELFLVILSDVPESVSPESYFLKRQAQEKNLLDCIRRFEEKRDRFGMEYLMMSRYQVPTDSMENVAQRLKKLALINDILDIRPLARPSLPVMDLDNFDLKKKFGPAFKDSLLI